LPRQLAPAQSIALVGGGRYELSSTTAARFRLLVFYRGLHCPLCRLHLRDLAAKAGAFAERGVEVIALSCDSPERAATARSEWGLEALSIGYGLTPAEARAWGLYLSQGRGATSKGLEEPAVFAEPGLFVLRADRTLQLSIVQSTPFARPAFVDVIRAIDFVIARDYPPRGELVHIGAAQSEPRID
jgi:peroxiredoxin